MASEAISVGNLQIALPGIGSYVARAIQERDLYAVWCAIIAMTVTILIYDQLLFRPLVAWADKFRYEQTAAQTMPRSWILDLFQRTRIMRAIGRPIGMVTQTIARARLALPLQVHEVGSSLRTRRWVGFAWYGFILLGIGYALWSLSQYFEATISLSDVSDAARNGDHNFRRSRARAFFFGLGAASKPINFKMHRGAVHFMPIAGWELCRLFDLAQSQTVAKPISSSLPDI